MSNVLKMLSRGGAVSAETDANFKQTVLLLHGDGTNGAQNNTFLDGSTNNFTITRNGNTTQGTFSPFSVGAGEWGNFFDGNGDFLSSPNNAAIHVLGSDFCLEGWFYLTAAQGNYGLYSTYNANAGYIVRLDTTFIRFYCESSPTDIIVDRTYTFTQGQWYHFAVTNSGGTGRIFINGELQGATFSFGTPTNSAETLQIGQTHTLTNAFPGYLSNFRIVKGSAVYTSAFTPSTTPLTAITNTSLLTCQSNRFVDNSTNAFAVTRNGDVRVTPFSPFAPSAAYDPAVNGGSGYFDGTGDMLSTPTDSSFLYGAGDFTYEFWVYHNSISGQQTYFSRNASGSSNGVYIYKDTSNFVGVYYTSQIATSSIPITAGQWYHIVVSRLSGTLKIFINGVERASVGNSTNLTESIVRLGADGSTSLHPFSGYMSGVRILKGTGYSSITVPTAPPTPITNTSLLLNFTNAGIFDNTGKNNLETVGNAQIDTTTKKYGTGSMEFDGTGDWLLVPKFWNIAASENFTIECWIYLTAAQASYRAIISDINNANLGSSKYIMISSTGLEIQTGTVAGTISTITQSFSQNTWYHLAVVRSSGTIAVYVDGVSKTVSQASQTGAFLDQGTSFYIGRWASTAYEFNGFIDDLRITKGVARYPTEPFPTKAFPDL
jgi:hypothetical protein